MSEDELRRAVEETAADLGININFDPDADLQQFKPGQILTLGQLRAMPDGTVVWVYCKVDGDEGVRINQAMRINADPKFPNNWGLSDGSSFAAEFHLDGSDDQKCIHYDFGEMRLSEAIKK